MDLYVSHQILRVKKLDGYDDQNFHVTVDMAVNKNPHIEKLCDLGYVFKILNVEDSVNQTHICKQYHSHHSTNQIISDSRVKILNAFREPSSGKATRYTAPWIML